MPSPFLFVSDKLSLLPEGNNEIDPKMGPLASIVYCADKLEPGRQEISEAYRERCLSMSIPDMVASVCSHSIEWLRRTGRPVAPQTIILYNSLIKTVRQA